MGRYVGAVIVGAVVAFGVVFGIEKVGHSMYPPPPGVDFSNAEALRGYIESAPSGALMWVLAAWVVATLAGGIAAGRIARSRPGVVSAMVGLVILIAAVVNLVMIPHPTWFWVSAVLAIPAAALLASSLTVRTSRPSPA